MLGPMKGISRFQGIPIGHFSPSQEIVVDIEICPGCSKDLLLVYRELKSDKSKFWRRVECQNPICSYEDQGENLAKELEQGRLA